MSGLSRDMGKLKMLNRPGKKPIKQQPIRFSPKIMSKIKEKSERLLKRKFTGTPKYVKWLANIIHNIHKNGTLMVCIYFRDLNNAPPKNEYLILVAEMLVNSIVCFDYLIMLDGYSRYNQIFIVEEDIQKMTFGYPGALGTCKLIVISFGLKKCRSNISNGYEFYVPQFSWQLYEGLYWRHHHKILVGKWSFIPP